MNDLHSLKIIISANSHSYQSVLKSSYKFDKDVKSRISCKLLVIEIPFEFKSSLQSFLYS